MRSSFWNRFGIVSLLLMVAVLGSSCTYYKRVMARMNLVDGAQAYNERKFDEAMEKFGKAVSYDPEGTTLESKTAQLFLARTLHSLFAGDRKKVEMAERAIEEYKKALPGFIQEASDGKAAADANPADEKLRAGYEKNKTIVGSIVSAIGSLYENLQKEDEWQKWQVQASENAELPNEVRANSLVGLAAKKYNCANDITDSTEVKKTVTKGSEQVFQFSKPEREEDFSTIKKCVEEGTTYIDKAIELNGESDSAWSYKASLLVQSMRIAEMDGKEDQIEGLKKKSEEAKAKFEELAKIRREKEEEAAKKLAEEVGGKATTEKDAAAEGDKAPDAGEKKADDAPEGKKDDAESKDNK